ncbi:MAG: tyrosine-protein phosphatase [Lachnospiraceae bacterium]|nr:tyrosine-protein phosphatase [Lachnospiraceae bacterium]
MVRCGDFLENLTGQEVRWLLDNDVTTIVDLRSDEEAAKKPFSICVPHFAVYLRQIQST